MPKKPAKTDSLPSEAHEKLCNHCGQCCYQKIIVGRTVYTTPFPCEFLDTSTNLCTIYERRHELNPLCLSIKAGMKYSAFPAECHYVPEFAPKGYRPARELLQEHVWQEFDDLADDLSVSDEVREKVRARGPAALPMYQETFERLRRETDALHSPSLAAMAEGISTWEKAINGRIP